MKTLKNKNIFIETLLDISREAVICYDIKSKQILKSNEVARGMYGYDEETLSKLYLSDIFENFDAGNFRSETKHSCNQKKKNGNLFFTEIQVIELEEALGVLIIKNKEQQSQQYQNYKDLYQRLEETNRIVRQVDAFSSSKIGEEYFQSIVNALSKILDADYVFITEEHLQTKTGETLYSSAKGETIPSVQYELAGTPCADVFNNNICVYPKNIQQLFPQDLLLAEMGIEAYAGVPISIRQIETKTSRWILVALFSKELEDKEFYRHILMLFAQKIQAERERTNLLNVIKENAIESKKFRDIILRLTLDQDFIQGNPQGFFSKVTEQLADALKTRRVGVWLFENDNKELACIDLYEMNSRGHTRGERMTAKEYPRYFRAMLEEHCIYADDALNDLRTIEFKENYLLPLNISSMLDAGILVRGRLVGVICTEHIGDIRNWTADEIIFVNTISSLIANTIINSEYIRLNEEYLAQNNDLKELIEVNKEAELAANFGTWKWSLDDNYIFWSDNMCRIHGIEQEQFRGNLEETMEFIHPEDRELIFGKIQEMMVSKSMGVLEYRIQTAAGETKYVEGASRVYLDENQNVSIVWGSVRDITDRKLKEKELLESQVKYKDLFDNIKDGMCILDTKGNILHHNKVFPKILGYDEEDLKTLKIPDIVHPEQHEISRQQYSKLAKDGSYEDYETRIISKDGSVVWIQVNSNAIYDENGKLVGSNDIIRDITIRKKAEIDLLKKNAEIRERVKELNCLYRLSELANRPLIIIEQILKEFIEFLPQAYQYAEITCAKVVYEELEFATSNYKESPWGQQSDIRLNDKKIGEIKVFYLEEKPEEHEGPFLKEERYLINTLADILGNTVNRKKTEIELQKIREVLEETSQIARVGGWEMHLDTRQLYWTDVARAIHEIPSDYDINTIKSSDFLKNEIDLKKAVAATQNTMKTGEPYDLEVEINTFKGHSIWIRTIGKGEFKDGKCVRLYGAIQDITERKKTEIELQKMQELLQETSKIARVGGWEVDIVNQKLYWSDVVKEIHEVPLDYQPDLKNSPRFLKDEENRLKGKLATQNAISTGDPYDLELEVITAKGNEIWIRTIGKAEMKDGVCVRVYGTMQDITQQKKLEQELAKANETEFAKLYHQQKVYSDQIQQKSKELDRFFELSLDMICIADKNGVTQRINPAFYKTLGYSEKDMVGKNLNVFMHIDDYEKTLAAVEKMLIGDGMFGFTNRYLTKTGDVRIFSWHAVQDPDSELTYAIARDITQERKASKEIEDLKYTLDQTAIVMIIDRDEKIISVNDKFCEISGYSRKEIIGQYHQILDSNHHSDAFWTKLKNTIESGKIWQGEIKERAKNGSFYWTYTSCVPFFDEHENVVHYIITQLDITDRKQLEIDLRKAEEKALKNAKIKEDFLSNMSHEIRTPMNAVLGFSRLLLQAHLDKKQYDYAHAIYTSAENLLVIVNDILDFSKIESGKFELEKISFDFRKVILSAVNTLKISIENKNIDFILEIAPEVPAQLVGAPNRITQILLNLIGNALKFTNEGHIRLKINLKEKNLLLFEIEDTGIGISQDKLDLIFESFTQAENYTTRMYGGTGLGLSISKKLVALMGGDIAVKSQLGKGSTFFFTLPFTVLQNIESEREELTQIAKLNLNQAQLLVVDDNRLNRELVTIYLNMLQCNFDEATNGEEALQMVARNKYDLILMDIQMPVMDGMEATMVLRQQDKKTPIIAMTAHALQREKQRCFDIGMNDYLAKPFKKEDLEAILLKHITGKVEIIEVNQKENKKNAVVSASDVCFDLIQLKSEVGEDMEMIHHVLNLFKEEINTFAESIQKAMVAEDIKNIGQLAHKIKPNFQLFQMSFLAEILEELERLAVAENGGPIIYERCNEVLKYIPIIQLRIAEELFSS